MVNLAASCVMRTDPEVALYGRYCVPSRLVAEGANSVCPIERRVRRPLRSDTLHRCELVGRLVNLAESSLFRHFSNVFRDLH
mgnify:CR=1 FL=1